MSTASTVSPALGRNPSRRQQSYAIPAGDRPHRALSTTGKPATTPSAPLRSHSQSQTRPTSSSQQPALADVARKDYETNNVARPSSSRRSSSRDRSYAVPPSKRPESTREARHSSTRPGHSRNSSHMSATAAAVAVANGGSSTGPSSGGTKLPSDTHPGSGASTKRRTTISAQTGQWTLGKTIGAGSMGKVKLAKNLETGEQVC